MPPVQSGELVLLAEQSWEVPVTSKITISLSQSPQGRDSAGSQDALSFNGYSLVARGSLAFLLMAKDLG